METQAFSKLRDNLADVMAVVDSNEPVVLTHHGAPRAVMISPRRWNEIAELLDRYQDLETLRQLSDEMDDPENYSTVEQAEAIFQQDGLL